MSRKPVELRYSLLRLQAPASEPAGGSGRAGRLLSTTRPPTSPSLPPPQPASTRRARSGRAIKACKAVANLMRFPPLSLRPGQRWRLPARRIGDADRGDGRAWRRKQSKGATSPQPAPGAQFRPQRRRPAAGWIVSKGKTPWAGGGRLEEPDGSEQQPVPSAQFCEYEQAMPTISTPVPNECPAILARRAGSRRSSPTHRKAKHAWPNSVNPDARLPLQAGSGLRAGQPEDEPEPQRGRRLDPDPPPWK